jgi:hypothetical protein
LGLIIKEKNRRKKWVRILTAKKSFFISEEAF